MKLAIVFSAVLILSGCSSKEDEAIDVYVRDKVKEMCKETGGQLAFGLEVNYNGFYETVSVGYYCLSPKTEEKINE